MIRYILTITLLAALLSSVALADDAAVDLRPIWRVGQASKFRVTQTELTTAGSPGGDEQSSTMDIALELTWKVKSADPAGGGVAQMTVNSIVIKLTDADGTVHNVTLAQAEETHKKTQEWITALTDSTVDVTVAADGAIGSIRGIEAVHRKAPEQAKGLDEKFFQDLAMDLSVMAGGKANVKPGQSWKHTFTNSHSAGELTFDATNELQAVQKVAGIDVAQVSRKAKLTLKPDLSDLPPDAPPVQVRLTEGSYSSQLMFDLSRHELVGGHFDQTVEIAVDVTLEGQKRTRTTKEVSSTQLLRIAEE